MNPAQPGTAILHSIDGWIDLTVEGQGTGRLAVSGAANDCPGTGNEFRFTIPGCDQTFLPSLIDQLDDIMSTDPIANGSD